MAKICIEYGQSVPCGIRVIDDLTLFPADIDLTLFPVADVDPRPPPIIHQGPQNQTLPIDSVAKMVCFCSGRPKPVIRWYKNRQLLRMFDPRITVHSGSLQISG